MWIYCVGLKLPGRQDGLLTESDESITFFTESDGLCLCQKALVKKWSEGKRREGVEKKTFSDLLLFSFNREEERREKGLVKGNAYITTEVSAPATEPNHGQAFL